MADFMISYASVDRDAARLVAESLRRANHTVWMDATVGDGASHELPGIPGGQEHWSTICAAIDEASTFLIMDTPAWHKSAYCKRELAYAREWGKRIAVIQWADKMPSNSGADLPSAVVRSRSDEMAMLLDALEPGADLAEAHARLLSELRSSGSSRFSRAQIRDADLLATGNLAAVGLSTNAALASLIVQLLRVGRQRRRRLQVGGSAFLALLLALTIMTMIARASAEASQTLARTKTDYASALALAQQSRSAGTTADALGFARRGVALSSNDATRAALRAAEVNAYRSTVRMGVGVPAAAAVSNDGRSALVVQGRRVFTVDAAAGRVTPLRLDSGASRKIALSPDGHTGYVIDVQGGLHCLDVGTGHFVATPQRSVVALSLGVDGVLWWLTRDSHLYRSTGCPSSSIKASASQVNDTIAFLVAQPENRLFALTTHGRVEIYRLPADGEPIGTPQKQVTISAVPAEGKDHITKSPTLVGTNAIMRCGGTVHVIAAFEYGLTSDAHVALTSTGDLIGKRITNLEMPGVGCAPGGQAWAAPLITPHAIALPSGGPIPADEIDMRDRGGRVVIANSPDSSRSVVVHTDGRVDVLNVADLRWAEAAGSAVVAVPLRSGRLTVDADGTLRAWRDGTVKQIGTLAAPPVFTTIAMADTAYVAAGDRLFALNRLGIKSSIALPGQIGQIHFAAGAGTIVVTGRGFTASVLPDLSGHPAILAESRLINGEEIGSVTIDADHTVIGTTYGRVLVQAGRRTVASVDTGVAGNVLVRTLPDRDIIVAGGNGMLSRYSPDLHLKASHLFGPSATFLDMAANGNTMLVALSGNYSVWAVDTATLQPITKVATKTPDVRLVALTADGRAAIQLIPTTNQADGQARVVTTKL